MCSLVFLWRKVDTFSSQRVSDPMSYRGRSCVFTYFGAEHRAPVYVKTMYVKTHQTVHFKYVHLLHVSYTSFFFSFCVATELLGRIILDQRDSTSWRKGECESLWPQSLFWARPLSSHFSGLLEQRLVNKFKQKLNLSKFQGGIIWSAT